MFKIPKIIMTISVLFSLAAFANSDKDKSRGELARFIDQELSGSKFSGSVYLACEGKVYLNKGYGPGGNAMKDKYYDIGSMTKQFTAAAIMKLVQDGKLNLNDPLHKWIKPLKDPKKRDITIEDLITHRSGMSYPELTEEEEKAMDDADDHLSNKKALLNYKPGYTEQEHREGLTEMIDQTPLTSNRGEKFDYHNVNYSALAYIVEQASGQKFNDYLRDSVLSPLGVQCGFNDHKSIAKESAAQGHSRGRPAHHAGYYFDGPGYMGATGLICRAEDVVKWYQSQEQLFTDKTVLDRVRYLKGSPYKTGNKGYSYGLEFDGKDIFHGGNTSGFISNSRYNPDSKCIAVTLTNEETNFEDVNFPVEAWFNVAPKPMDDGSDSGHATEN